MSTVARFSIIGVVVVIAVLILNTDAFAQMTALDRAVLNIERMVRRLGLGIALISFMVTGLMFMVRGGIHGPSLIGVVAGAAIALFPDAFIDLVR